MWRALVAAPSPHGPTTPLAAGIHYWTLWGRRYGGGAMMGFFFSSFGKQIINIFLRRIPGGGPGDGHHPMGIAPNGPTVDSRAGGAIRAAAGMGEVITCHRCDSVTFLSSCQ